MTGDRFRARADKYIKAARTVTDPVDKLALVDVAQRWLRLAVQIDGAAIHASRNSEAPATQVRHSNFVGGLHGDFVGGERGGGIPRGIQRDCPYR
jgi:hypothetical protein